MEENNRMKPKLKPLMINRHVDFESVPKTGKYTCGVSKNKVFSKTGESIYKKPLVWEKNRI